MRNMAFDIAQELHQCYSILDLFEARQKMSI